MGSNSKQSSPVKKSITSSLLSLASHTSNDASIVEPKHQHTHNQRRIRKILSSYKQTLILDKIKPQ